MSLSCRPLLTLSISARSCSLRLSCAHPQPASRDSNCLYDAAVLLVAAAKQILLHFLPTCPCSPLSPLPKPHCKVRRTERAHFYSTSDQAHNCPCVTPGQVPLSSPLCSSIAHSCCFRAAGPCCLALPHVRTPLTVTRVSTDLDCCFLSSLASAPHDCLLQRPLETPLPTATALHRFGETHSNASGAVQCLYSAIPSSGPPHISLAPAAVSLPQLLSPWLLIPTDRSCNPALSLTLSALCPCVPTLGFPLYHLFPRQSPRAVPERWLLCASPP